MHPQGAYILTKSFRKSERFAKQNVLGATFYSTDDGTPKTFEYKCSGTEVSFLCNLVIDTRYYIWWGM